MNNIPNSITIKKINDIIRNQLTPISYYGRSLQEEHNFTPEQQEAVGQDLVTAGKALQALVDELTGIKTSVISVGRTQVGDYNAAEYRR